MKNSRIIAPLLSGLLLAACAVGPDYRPPETKVPQRFEHLEPATYSDEAAVAAFWTQFQDETLERLVDDALAANHDLRIALTRVAEARALRGETRLDLAPTVTAGAGYTEQS
jgi:outer membrane protein TolC